MDMSHSIIRSFAKPLLPAAIPREFSASGLCVELGFCWRAHFPPVLPRSGVREITRAGPGTVADLFWASVPLSSELLCFSLRRHEAFESLVVEEEREEVCLFPMKQEPRLWEKRETAQDEF